MNISYDAIVVGGGVNGGSVAYNLSKRGFNVLLLEKDRLASKSSGAAAGMLAAQAELDEDGPLFHLARKSREMFPTIAKEIKSNSGIDIELINKGMLKVALTEKEKEDYKRIIRIQQAAGEQAEWLNGKEIKLKEQALSSTVIGAMYIEKDGHVAAPHLTMGFVKSAAQLGAVIKEHIEVSNFLLENGNIVGVQTNEGNYFSDKVIVTGGAWSGKLLAEVGLQLDTYPVKGECFSVKSHSPLLSSTIFSHGCYLVPKKGGRIIVGATVKPKTFNETVTFDGVSSLMDKAKRLVPSIIETEWEKAWAGIRPQTGDGLPFLGQHPNYKGLFVATGHFRNGILLSPITGEIISDLVEGKRTSVDIELFRCDRYMKTPV